MTTSTPSHSAASTPLRLLVVDGVRHISSYEFMSPQRRGCDLVMYGNLSPRSHIPMHMCETRLLYNLIDREACRRPKTYNIRCDADNKATFS